MNYTTDEEYREALLRYFNITEYDTSVIIEKTNIVYHKIKDIDAFKKQILIVGSKQNIFEPEIAMILLFSYENFIEFHALLQKHSITM